MGKSSDQSGHSIEVGVATSVSLIVKHYIRSEEKALGVFLFVAIV